MKEALIKLAPGFLKRYPMGLKLLNVLGDMCDDIVARLAQAALSSSVSSPSCKEDALPFVGNERHLPRFIGESLEVYSDRLSNAKRTHDLGGSWQTIKEQCEGLLGGSVTVEVLSAVTTMIEPYYYPYAGPLVVWRSRFYVFVEHGTLLTASQIDQIKQVIKYWKPVRLKAILVLGAVSGPLIGRDFVIGTSIIGGVGSTVVVNV